MHLVGYGRANHSGLGDPDVLAAVVAERPAPGDNEATVDGNRAFYGFECENLRDGKDPWPEAQVTRRSLSVDRRLLLARRTLRCGRHRMVLVRPARRRGRQARQRCEHVGRGRACPARAGPGRGRDAEGTRPGEGR